tara:strand:+ start:16623 stop:18263 length:1641 start_codon:yes stop_codon:yes gene_type:complete
VLKNFFQQKKINLILITLLLFSLYFSFSITNIYYNALAGADNYKYFQNILFIFGEANSPYDNQGLIYFFIVSFFIKLRTKSFSYSEDNYYLSDLDKVFLSETILFSNLIIFIFGLVGLYFFMKIINFTDTRSLFVLIFFCYFPSITYLRMNMKPEILAFSLLPWIFYYFENYLDSKKNIDLFKIALLVAITISSKGSIFAMIVLILFLKYLLHINKFSLKSSFLGLGFLLLFTFSISLENTQFGIGNLLSRSPEINYDNKAPLNIFWNIDIERLLKDPKKDYHRNSLIAITLIDLNSDYFELNWKEDSVLFSKNIKPLVVNENEKLIFENEKMFNLDTKNKQIVYHGPGQNYTHYYLNYIGLIYSIVFISLLFRMLFKKENKNKFYLTLPFIGIFILLFHVVLGFPQNNFDPNTGDTFKVFYYSFLIPYPIIIILKNINTNIKNIIFVTFFFIFSLVNLGFPKANDENLDLEIIYNVENTIFCEVNKGVIEKSFITANKVNCQNEEINGPVKTKLINIPYVSVLMSLIILFYSFKEIFKLKYKHLN